MSENVGEAQLGPFVYNEHQRRWNDTTTWLAEVLDGKMRTPFEYMFDGQELYAEDGSALKPVFEDSIKRAQGLPGYEQRRRNLEMNEYDCMIAMAKDEMPNVMVVVSDFPPELIDASSDVGGYNVARKQTMLRVIYKADDGKIKMFSQSLDQSNRTGLEAVYGSLGFTAGPGELLGQRMHLQIDADEDKEFLVDQLTGVYDRSMQSQYGGDWTAGRRGRQVDTYQFVCSQRDLLNAYLATTDGFKAGDKEYNLAAAITARLNKKEVSNAHSTEWFNDNIIPVAAHVLALQEMHEAGNTARQTGQTFSGCGASIGSDSSNMPGSPYEQAGYGNKSDKLPDDRYGSRYFKCPKTTCSYINERPQNELLPRCKACGTDVSCGSGDTEPKESFFSKLFEEIVVNSLDDMQALGDETIEQEKKEKQLEQVNG